MELAEKSRRKLSTLNSALFLVLSGGSLPSAVPAREVGSELLAAENCRVYIPEISPPSLINFGSFR